MQESNTLTKESIKNAIEMLKKNQDAPYQNLFHVDNKNNWLYSPYIPFNLTEEELSNVDEKGFIINKYGVDCYLAKPISVN